MLFRSLWTNYLTGETAEGGTWREEHHDYLSVPLWVRENSMIAVQQNTADGEALLEMKVYGLTAEAHAEVYQDEKLATSVTLKREGGRIHGEVKGNTKVKIRFVGEMMTETAGAEIVMEGRDAVLSLQQSHGAFLCTSGTADC